jgi:hypothetical protein
MDDTARFQLLGSYTTPTFRVGDMVWCEVRGEVVLTGLSSGPIPWPIARRTGKGPQTRARALAVYGVFAEAIRRESAQAVGFWWGVTPQTVTVWRHALGVQEDTEGTMSLRQAHAQEPWAREARQRAHAKASDPVRREKIRQAKKGKPRPPGVLDAAHEAWRGSHHTDEAREKMSRAHRARGTHPPTVRPWTEEEDGWLRSGLSPKEVAQRTGRSLSAVYAHRRVLELPDGRRR